VSASVYGFKEQSIKLQREETPLESHFHDFALKARADKLRLLYHQSYPAVFISMANALLLSMILSPYLDQLLVVGWVGAIFCVSIVRMSLFLGYRRVENETTSFLSWERPYFVVLVLSSLVWGLGCVWMMSTASFLHQAVIYCFLIGMAGGAISVYSAVQTLVLTIVAALVLPATTWLLFQGELTSVLLGIGGTIFFLSSIRATKILAEDLHRSFLLNHQLLVAKQRAELLARIDYLTGLHNRGYFNELAAAQAKFCQRHSYPVSLILLDVDEFKKINDSHGHYSGDLALQHLSVILKKSIRSSDICGRIGGEEFAILLPNADLGDAKITAERIRSTIENTLVETKDSEFKFTVSLGIATGNIGVEKLLRMADKAMYRAKEAGRNQICHYDSLVDGVLDSS
jgi:diguanylate cyclase (GGDEF)-like protein